MRQVGGEGTPGRQGMAPTANALPTTSPCTDNTTQVSIQRPAHVTAPTCYPQRMLGR